MVTSQACDSFCSYIKLQLYLYEIKKDESTFIYLKFALPLSFLKINLSISLTFLRVIDFKQIL